MGYNTFCGALPFLLVNVPAHLALLRRYGMAEEREATLRVPPSALIVLVGPAASGKSSWAARHFEGTQIVSSDTCRAIIADDESDQLASHDAFRLFHFIISERLKRGLMTVADSTALQPTARSELLKLAAQYHRPVIAVVFAIGADLQTDWNMRRNRHVPNPVLAKHQQQLRQALAVMCDEGFQQIAVMRTPEEIRRLQVRIGSFLPEHDLGPFDVIGDVHGCSEELGQLLSQLGYVRRGDGCYHPAGRRAIFVGDLSDRGPANVAVWQLVLGMVEHGHALIVAGNHDNKLMRWLMGRPVRIGKGLQGTITEIEALPEPEQTHFRERLVNALRVAPGYLLLDQGKLVVTHAGIHDDMIGRWDRHIAAFCLYGDVAGYDQEGMPIRRNWSAERADQPGRPLIVYGHVVVEQPLRVNDTIDIDTGCCFGGQLTAYRYPEDRFVQVAALRTYADHRTY